jgi:hypothetical protein
MQKEGEIANLLRYAKTKKARCRRKIPMKKISLLGVVFCVALICLAIRPSRGQQQAKSSMPSRIVQGGTISAHLSVDKAPNVAGTLAAYALYPQGAKQFELSCNLTQGQTTCTTANTVPLDAPVGDWTVQRITFTPSAPQSQTVELSRQGNASFKIEPHGDLNLPSSATVSNIQQ